MAFIVTVLASLALMVILQFINAPLKTEAAPLGILSFEFAGTAANAQRMVASWNDGARDAAQLGLWVDFLFIPAYSSAIALGCWLVRRRWRDHRVGVVLAYLQPVAGLLDMVENVSLLRILDGQVTEGLAATAWWCAAVKFAIVAAGLIFLLASVLFKGGWRQPPE